MTCVLVTGANGHIGANVVRDLLAHDHEPVPFVRESSNVTGLEGLGLELRRGDVTDAESVLAAARGCEAILHLASPYRVWARDPNEIVEPAVVGTENVLRAAKEHGMDRVVLTSSSNAVGFSTPEVGPLDETSWNENPKSPYLKAKLLGERRAWELAEELGVDLITTLPTGVLGRLDYRMTPTTQPFLDALNGKGPAGVAGNMVDVRDVARGHVLALERGVPGERYILGGDNVQVTELADLVEAIAGKRPAEGLPPRWLLWPAAYMMTAISSITGNAPAISPDLLRDLPPDPQIFFDCSKAKRDLGLEPRGAAEVMDELARWGLFMGALKPRVAEHVAKRLEPDPSWVR